MNRHHIEALIERQIRHWNRVAHLLQYVPGQSVKTIEPEQTLGCSHPVICVSRHIGSGARAINAILCEQLGYTLFGRALIDEIAHDLHVQRRLVDNLDEMARGELETMIDTYLRGHEISSEEYLHALMRVIETLTLQGGVVLLGRGASFIVGHRAALRVFVTGSVDQRVERVMAYNNLDAETARRTVLRNDGQRKAFVRKYWKTDMADPLNYDLVLNTDRLRPEKAADMIFTALRNRGYDPGLLALGPELAARTA